jgi:hypothetical protein
VRNYLKFPIKFSQFAGVWYSIQESSPPRLPCLHYKVTVDASGSLSLTFIPYSVPSKAIQKNSADVTQGFNIQINFDLLKNANFQVFATDYGEKFYFIQI